LSSRNRRFLLIKHITDVGRIFMASDADMVWSRAFRGTTTDKESGAAAAVSRSNSQA
jgi:hypothetical protein